MQNGIDNSKLLCKIGRRFRNLRKLRQMGPLAIDILPMEYALKSLPVITG